MREGGWVVGGEGRGGGEGARLLGFIGQTRNA